MIGTLSDDGLVFEPSREDLERLQRLREGFLRAGEGVSPLADYWRDRRDLELYDAVLAARIGRKWDAVLDEVVDRLPALHNLDTVVDWGCGTGIATRRLLERVEVGRLRLHDRSSRAIDFAKEAVQQKAPGTECLRFLDDPVREPDLLLISHVLDELGVQAEADLLDRVESAKRVLWVEAGTQSVSRRLAAHRDRLRERFHVVAPCTHSGGCPTLIDNDRDWCHFFAEPDTEWFTDGDWVRLGRELGIDLRSLPYAFLCLTRVDEPTEPPGPRRLLGRAEVRPKQARFTVCSEAGLERIEQHKSTDPTLHRALRRNGYSVRHP